MSYLGPRPEQSTTAEVSLLTALNNLGISAANESIQKTGVDSFANVAAAGTGTVTSVSVTTANGVSGTVATATSTPAITLTLGAITPSTVNALTLASQAVGFTIAGGTTSKTLTIPLDASVSGTNTGDNVAASTSVAGLAPQATAPAANILNVLGIANGETAYTNKSILEQTTDPSTQAFGDAAVKGTSLAAAHADHKHAMMAAPTSVSGNAGTVTVAAETGDTSSSIAFVTDVSGSLPIKTNTNMTFNASTGVATFASTVLTTTDINGGTVDGATIGASSATTGKFTSVETTGDIELGAAADTTIHRVSAGLVSIEGANIMTVSSADTVTGVKTLGTTGAIKLGSAVTDKCEIRLNDSALNDETWSGTVLDAVAGATLAVGDVCYLKTADGQWYLNDGILDGTDAGFKLKLGICVLAANDNGATKMLLDGLIASAAFPAFTIGAPVYIDDTAGDLVVEQPSTTNFAIRVVGEAVSATVLHFHPSNDYIVKV